MLKKAKHYLEAAVVYLLFTALRQFSLDSASAIGSLMARSIGPYLSAHKTARANLKMVFPNLSRNEQNNLLDKMWDHLGRVAAELAYLQNDAILKRIKVTGAENLPAHGKPAFMFSGHIGNWELLSCLSQIGGRPITGVYREANNPIVDDMITRTRSPRYVNLIPKGTQGAVKLVRSIKNNEAIALLVDQKMNDGIPVPFFGRDAMTASAIAELALRYDTPIVPAYVLRTGGANFEGIIYPALDYQKTGNKEKDVYNIMLAINQTLEDWIRKNPEQWFWVHKRWPKDNVAKNS